QASASSSQVPILVAFSYAKQLLSMLSLVCLVSRLSPKLLLLAVMIAGGWPAFASEIENESKPVQQQAADQKPSQDNNQQDGNRQDNGQQDNHDATHVRQASPAAPPASPKLCEALGGAAVANGLPLDFFPRLIWQESPFRPNAI